MRTLLIVALTLVGCGGARYPADPQPSWDEEVGSVGGDSSPSWSQEAQASSSELGSALARRLVVHTRRDGTRVYAKHCRDGPVDCEARIAVLASMIQSAAAAHDLDPWMLAAIAVRESMLDPSAIGARGEAGIVQLHPRGVGHDVRYVLDEDYRNACQSRLDACQGPVLDRGAKALADAIAHCGSLRSGLGRYASGRCSAGSRYFDRVTEEMQRLRSSR